MVRLIPPVAAPVRVAQLATSLLVTRGRPGGEFAAALARETGMPHCALYGSGRAALAAFLRASARRDADEVVIPAYTCWSVPAAVVRAGLRVRTVDVDPLTLGVDPDQVASALTPRTAAVVVAHLLGPSVDVAGVARACRSRMPSVRIVEDAAQAWPGRDTAADAVVLSFGRGKPLALGTGGALLYREATLDPPGSRRGGWTDAATLAATVILSRPAWYRVPESLPALGVGETTYEPAFPADRPFHDWQGTLGLRLLQALPRLVVERTRHARRIADAVRRAAGWTVLLPGYAEGPVRLPVLAPTGGERQRVRAALRRSGVGASVMYPGTIEEIPQLRAHLAAPGGDLPGARRLAECLLTLPVYPFLSDDDTIAIAGAFERATASSAELAG